MKTIKDTIPGEIFLFENCVFQRLMYVGCLHGDITEGIPVCNVVTLKVNRLGAFTEIRVLSAEEAFNILLRN